MNYNASAELQEQSRNNFQTWSYNRWNAFALTLFITAWKYVLLYIYNGLGALLWTVITVQPMHFASNCNSIHPEPWKSSDMGHHSTACKKNQQTLIAELEGDKKGRLKREDKKQRKTQHVSKERAKKEKKSTKKKKVFWPWKKIHLALVHPKGIPTSTSWIKYTELMVILLNFEYSAAS